MTTRIYVGNLPFSADNAQLPQVFGAFGEVFDAHLVMDRESEQSKGFAFVEMGSEEARRKQPYA
jgi:RNA recognition motif-containing protein